MERPEKRDHIFISYATEDWWFVKWLSIKLISNGYAVWCDKLKLFGGEPYPKDIETALVDRTFRIIAVLSKNSIVKDNPRKEWTKGLNIGKERNIADFLIPINLDDLKPSEISWIISDLKYISFHVFAAGLNELLVKLKKINAPRILQNGRNEVFNIVAENQFYTSGTEYLSSNILDVIDIPTNLFQYDFSEVITYAGHAELSNIWASYRIDNNRLLAFHPPSEEVEKHLSSSSYLQINSENNDTILGVPVENIIKFLIAKTIGSIFVSKGLKPVPNRDNCYYFVTEQRLRFIDMEGNSTWRVVVGQKTIAANEGIRTTYRWHLSPCIKVRTFKGHYFVQIVPKAYVTDFEGKSFSDNLQKRRVKRITKGWWNDDILNYQLLIASFLSSGASEISIGSGTSKLVLSSKLLQISMPVLIDEERALSVAKKQKSMEETDEDNEPDDMDDDEELIDIDEEEDIVEE